MESEKELIELVNEGDADAFEVLYRRYRDWVYRLAWPIYRQTTGDHGITVAVPVPVPDGVRYETTVQN